MNIFSSIFVVIGSIIGAGFASGKEIYTFFYVYGTKGIIGIIIAISLIGVIIYKSLKIITENNINNYDEFLKKITNSKSKSIESVLNFIINLFLIIVFFVMCAGFVAYFKQEFGMNQILSGLIIGTISYLILSNKMKGIQIFNSILMPLIIIVLILLGIKNIGIFNNGEISEVNNYNFLPMAVLYASYNFITLVSILIPMKNVVKNKKDILKISAVSSIIIIVLALVIFSLLLNIKTDIDKIELPAVYASRTFW